MTPSSEDNALVAGDSDSIPDLLRFSHEAMDTAFEILTVHPDGRYAEQAACAAFEELDRLERELSRFIPESDISRINTAAANESVKICIDTLECLLVAQQYFSQTQGAFDITIRPLFEYWQGQDRSLDHLDIEAMNAARRGVGMQFLQVDETDFTAARLNKHVQLDLGGIGKGYAVDRMAEMLREWDISAVLINGGGSSLLALDVPKQGDGWPVSLSYIDDNGKKRLCQKLTLKNQSLSASGLRRGRHIIDPRHGLPVTDKIAAWTLASDALTADILSTAFMVMSPDEVNYYCTQYPGLKVILVVNESEPDTSEKRVIHFGPQ
ncbi:MAG: FAD:protein FMN transferase [Sedimentisphaerales bacterium]|nr:FAD:protein FMN transferase [Sedimentisphaerales bacterium]